MTMRLLPLVALVIIMLIFLGYFILTSNRTKPVINNKDSFEIVQKLTLVENDILGRKSHQHSNYHILPE